MIINYSEQISTLSLTRSFLRAKDHDLVSGNSQFQQK